MIKEALRQSDGNNEVAASRLGLSHVEFAHRLKSVAD
jgi:transcriptional regulator with PAS, ATPase and Fis domain